MIGKHKDEIAHLCRLSRFVESTSEEGVQMMLDQLQGRMARITASANRYKLKGQRKEYLLNANAKLIRAQINELQFCLM